MVDNDYSPLHSLLSGELSTPDKIQRLLQLGIPINCQSIYRVTPLHIAVKNHNCSLDVLRYLLDNGADVNARDYNLRNPLLYLLRFGNDDERAIETLLLLLDRGIYINVGDSRGRTVLHYALQKVFHTDFIKLLLDSGARINRICSAGCSPLHIAVNNKKVPWDTIKLLLDRGAYVCTSTKLSFLKPLHSAAKRRNSKIVKLMVDRGAPVNCVTLKQESPLFLSVCHNSTKVTKMLLNCGALVSCGISPIKAILSTHDIRVNKVALQKVQLLLKYALLEDAVLHTDCTCNLFSPCSVSEKLIQIWIECLREIHEMQLVSVDPKTNLAQFIIHLRFQIKPQTKDEIKSMSDQLLHLIYLNSYPLYSEVISGLIRKEYLIDKFENQIVYTPSKYPDPCSGVRKLVILNNHVLRMLTKYLSEVDLLHLVLAFYDSHD